MPFIAEAEFPTTYASVEELKQQYGFEYLRRNVRLCAELGADIVKTNWPGDAESFAKLVEATAGIPVVLAGGSRLEDRELLSRMEQAMAAGAIGCSVGRNIFMHERPEAITRALSRVIRERWTAEKALRRAAAGAGVMRAAFMTERQRRARSARCGGAEARSRAARSLKVEACGICGTDARTFFNGDPKAPAAVGAGARAGRRRSPRSVPTRTCRPAWPQATGCSSGRSSRAVSAGGAPRGSRTCASTTCSTATTRSRARTRSYAAVPPIATKNLIPLPARSAVGPRDRGRPVRVRAERDRTTRRPARRHGGDPGHRARSAAGRP